VVLSYAKGLSYELRRYEDNSLKCQLPVETGLFMPSVGVNLYNTQYV